MKKKISVIMLALIIAFMLVGCNRQLIDVNYKFDGAYVKIGEEWKDLKIEKWRDYEDGEQIQLTLEDGTVLVVHSVNCVLYKGQLLEGKK